MHVLIAYFSRRGSSFVRGEMINLPVGNTEVAANSIKTILGGTLFEIEAEHPYSNDYYACTKEAIQQLHGHARPLLKAKPNNIDDYDVIFVGYPNWCGTMPMPVWTFLSSFDFSNKALAPFCTHGGSGLGHSVSDIKSLCPSANILKALAIQDSKVHQSEDVIATWLKSLSLV